MSQESAFERGAISNKGASGLMQLMPATAARFGVTNIFDPKQNIYAGARYLRLLLDMFDGDVSLALAGYNAGEGAVKRYGYNVPPYPETINYVRKIRRRYHSLSGLSE
jgi:soluble lytic murein transglycosylase-like protein